jgi:molybdenum cofactor cytidylyltransferase
MVEIAAIILAAGRSSRYRAAGGQEPSKLLALLDGKPVVRRVAETALASSARPVIVVVGHESERIVQALDDLPLQVVFNAAYASGMASSLKAGIAALPRSAAGALILLADMPLVSEDLLDRLGAAFAGLPGAVAAAPMRGGRRGNPVLLSRVMFGAIGALDGDEGARRLLAEAPPGAIAEVAVDDSAATLDVDTPVGMINAREALKGDRK